LLHQTEAGATSRVKRGSNLPLVSYTSDYSGIVVNTKLFHELLEKTICEYLANTGTMTWCLQGLSGSQRPVRRPRRSPFAARQRLGRSASV
jgi:hypothetical protein